MGTKGQYKFSLRKKLALFITILAIITYSTSAFLCIFSIQSLKAKSPLVPLFLILSP